MKYLSILALALTGLMSYGGTRLALKIPKTVEEAKRLLEIERENLVQAEQSLIELQRERNQLEPLENSPTLGALKKRHKLIEQMNKDLYQAQDNVAMQSRLVNRVQRELASLERQAASTEGQGLGLCQNCNDPEGSSLAASSVERDDQTSVPNVPSDVSSPESGTGSSDGTR